MLKRNKTMLLRFTESELNEITKNAQRISINREAYCRAILRGAVVQEAPQADFYRLICEVKRAGSNVDQLMKQSGYTDALNVAAVKKVLDELHDTEMMRWDTFRRVSE